MATKMPLVVPSSEGHGKLRSGSEIGLPRCNLGTTGTTMWFTVEYCQNTMIKGKEKYTIGKETNHNRDQLTYAFNPCRAVGRV